MKGELVIFAHRYGGRIAWLLSPTPLPFFMGVERLNIILNIADEDTYTPLLCATCARYEVVVKVLLERNDLYHYNQNKYGTMSLSTSTCDEHEELVKMFLK